MITRQHYSDDCLVCKIFKGQKGIKRKAGNPIASSISPTIFKPTSWQRLTPKKCHKCLSFNKVHICRKRTSVQNFVSTLERKGLSDAVVSNILRKRASSIMSNVIPLLGYGKMSLRVKILKESEDPESNIVTQNEILNLQRDLNLLSDQPHNICQFMKRKGEFEYLVCCAHQILELHKP